MINVLSYIFLIFYVLSYFIGFSSCILTFAYYRLERVMWLKYYLFLLALLSLLFFAITLKMHVLISVPLFIYSTIFSSLILFFMVFLVSFMIYIIPNFLFSFLKIEWTLKKNALFISASMIYFLLGVLYIILGSKFYILFVALFYIFIIVIFLIVFKYYKNIADKTAKIILKLFMLTSSIVMSLGLIYIIHSDEIEKALSLNIITDIIFILLYFWFNSLMTSYFLWYFISTLKVSSIKDENAIIYIENLERSSVKILTKREKEISNLLLEGKSNKEVSHLLDISLNTVNNHVANIYEKLDVKNRVEFVNKITK